MIVFQAFFGQESLFTQMGREASKMYVAVQILTSRILTFIDGTGVSQYACFVRKHLQESKLGWAIQRLGGIQRCVGSGVLIRITTWPLVSGKDVRPWSPPLRTTLPQNLK